MEKNEINVYTSNVKPVTDAKEVAMEAPERGRVPRCPTNIIEIVCRMYCKIPTEDRGTANHSCLFNSAITNSSLSLLIFDIFCNHSSSYLIQILLNVNVNPIFNGISQKKAVTTMNIAFVTVNIQNHRTSAIFFVKCMCCTNA